MAKRRSFSADFKTKVVLEIISGERSRAEACKHYQIKDGVLSRQFLDQALWSLKATNGHAILNGSGLQSSNGWSDG